MIKRENVKMLIMLISVLILCVASFVFFVKEKSAIWLFVCVFSLGYYIAKLINGFDKVGKNDAIMLGLTFLSLIISVIISFSYYPYIPQLNRLYFPKDSVDFKNEFFSNINHAPSPKLIFAFDNSGDALNDEIDSSLKVEYDDYSRSVIEFLGMKFSASEINSIIKKEKITYGDILKMRACFDLTKISKKNGQFVILKIGENNNSYDQRMIGLGKKSYEQTTEFKTIDNGIIQDEIFKILNTKNDEINTGFDSFILDLVALFHVNNIKSNRTNESLSECAVYVYSDFYHDYDKLVETKKDIAKITKDKKDLLRGVVQNYFIDRHPPRRKARLGMSILNENLGGKISDEETYFIIDSINKSTIVPIRVIKAKTQYWFYSDKQNEEISTEFRFVFDHNEKYCIRLVDDVKGLSIDGEEMEPIKEKCCDFINDNKNSFSLNYSGEKPTQEQKVRFEVIHNDIHYYVDCKFYKEWDRIYKWILPLIIGLLGLLLGLWSFKLNK